MRTFLLLRKFCTLGIMVELVCIFSRTLLKAGNNEATSLFCEVNLTHFVVFRKTAVSISMQQLSS